MLVFSRTGSNVNHILHGFLYVVGVMGYYQAQLNELIQYPDMRTEVFQIFREVGNAIVFCMLIEQALVRTSVESEPRPEKTCLRCFRPGPTETNLYSHRRKARSLKFQI